MLCKVRNPSRRGGWRSRECGAVGRRDAVRGVNDALDQVVYKDAKWFIGCLVCAAWWALTLVFCRSAYAAPTVEVDGNFAGYENGETYNGYIVVDAPNEYIATLTLIDEYSSLVQIDSDMYAKLSNSSSGGRFYELVQQWDKLGTNASGTSSNYPTWGGSNYFMDGLVTVYGYGKVWECVVTDSLISGAKDDFNTILDGGSLGGGGANSDPVIGRYAFLCTLEAMDIGNSTGKVYNYTVDNNGSVSYSENVDHYISNMQVNSNYEQYVNLYVNSSFVEYLNSLGHDKLVVQFINGDIYMYVADSYDISGDNPVIINFTSSYRYDSGYAQLGNGDNTVNIFLSWSSLARTNGNGSVNFSGGWLYEGDLGSAGDLPGDNNWPDDDTPKPPSQNPPTPPTVNPPTSPTPPTNTPYNPTNPTPPTNTTPPTGTTPIDYTPWLEAILNQLFTLTSYLETCFTWLGQELENHCQHIRDHMTSVTEWLGDYLINGMYDLLEAHHDYLKDLAKWIVDNMKWENSGGEFDDSNMIYWLKRIYTRQGTGDVNTRPVDIAVDYDGFAGWLGTLYDEVALDVSDTSLMALNSSLTGLQHTFPFSLPWDIKQVMQALDVSPVTPSASIPSGTSGVSYNVDLHWMDSAMVSVRAFELLVFIVYVMVHTKDLFGYLMGE